MRNCLRLLISVAMFFVAQGGFQGPVVAQGLGPSEATEHLATARALDAKCKYLSEADHDELAGFAAKAEIAVARTEGVETASSAVKTGKLAGEQMPCGPSGKEMVRSSLAAGRQAMRQAATSSAEEPEPRSQRSAARVIGGIGGNDQAIEAAAHSDPQRPEGPLARYRHEATAYYLELRCRHLPDRHAQAFWGRIVQRHQAMVDQYGGQRVMRAQAAAERLAARQACGSRSASFIQAAYGSLR